MLGPIDRRPQAVGSKTARFWLTKASIVIDEAGFDEAVNAYIECTPAGGKAIPSCPISSLGSELVRSGPSGTRASRRKGITAFATFVGALTLARIATSEEMAEEILDVAGQRLHRAE